jgi:dephospho-CoA kinase
MSPARPPIIGLAGGVGAGKTTVANVFADLGCVVVNSDELAREALRDPRIKQTLIQWWGEGILDDTKVVNRSKVAHIVFSDPAQRRRLEGLTHPWIEERRRERFAAAPHSTPALVIDAPLIFEAGLDRVCDAVIFVDAPLDQRENRVKAERGWDAAELTRREESQMPLDEKRRRADYVVANTGRADDLKPQIERLLRQILHNCRT